VVEATTNQHQGGSSEVRGSFVTRPGTTHNHASLYRATPKRGGDIRKRLEDGVSAEAQ